MRTGRGRFRIGPLGAPGVAWAALTWMAGAQAEPAPQSIESSVPRPIVEVYVVGSGELAGNVQEGLRTEDLAGFELRWHRVEQFDPANLLATSAGSNAARCWLDPSDARRTDLYCSDGSERFLVRALPPVAKDGGDAAALPRAVAASLRLLFDAGAPAFSRDEMRAWLVSADAAREGADQPPPPPRPRRRPFPLRPSAFYAASQHSSEVPFVHGPGLALALVDFGSRRHGTLQVGAQYGLPQSTAGSRFDLVLRSIGLRVGTEASVALGADAPGALRLGGRLAAGMDFERVALASNQAGYVAHRQTSSSNGFVVVAAFIASLRVHREASVFAELTASADPFEVHHDVLVGGKVERAVERSRIRPGGTVGVRLW